MDTGCRPAGYVENLFHRAFDHAGDADLFGVCLVGFTPRHLDYLEERTRAAAENILSRPVFVNMRGKSYIDLSREVTGRTSRTNYEAEQRLSECFESETLFLVIREISAGKFSRARVAAEQAAYLVRMTNESRMRGVRMSINVVLIDYAAFLQNQWEELSPYMYFNVPPLSLIDAAEEIAEGMSGRTRTDLPTLG